MASKHSSTFLSGLCVAVALAVATPAFADPTPPSATQKETARGLMETGDAKFAAGDYPGALHAYRSADSIMGVPTTSFAVARALVHLNQLVEAADMLAKVRRYPHQKDEPAAYGRARTEGAELEEDLLLRIPVVKVVLVGPAKDTPVTITVDGDAVERAADQAIRVNPGKRVIAASAPGYFPASVNVDLEEKSNDTVRLELAIDPSYQKPQPRERGDAISSDEPDGVVISPWTWASFATGGVGMIIGAATGGAVLAKTSDLEERCGGTQCDPSLESEHDDINTLANVSNVAFIIGGVGLAAGVVTLVLDLTGETGGDSAAIRPVIGPGYVGVGGAF
jgi:hypothetical protein